MDWVLYAGMSIRTIRKILRHQRSVQVFLIAFKKICIQRLKTISHVNRVTQINRITCLLQRQSFYVRGNLSIEQPKYLKGLIQRQSVKSRRPRWERRYGIESVCVFGKFGKDLQKCSIIDMGHEILAIDRAIQKKLT